MVAGQVRLRWAIVVVSSPGNHVVLTVLSPRSPSHLADLL